MQMIEDGPVRMSCEPPHWHDKKRPMIQEMPCKRAKKGKNQAVSDNMEGVDHIQSVVKSHLREGKDYTVDDFDIGDLLDTIPFAKLLSNVNTDADRCEIPVVSRFYEEQYMRQCVSASDVPCVMQNQCECMLIDPKHRFVGVAFVIPSERQISNGMCLLCLRKTTQILFYQTVHLGHSVNAVIQKHGNICNEPGEYHASAMLICPPNGPVHSMPLPIVAHQRNKYSVVESGGVLWVKQNNVHYEDFT